MLGLGVPEAPPEYCPNTRELLLRRTGPQACNTHGMNPPPRVFWSMLQLDRPDDPKGTRQGGIPLYAFQLKDRRHPPQRPARETPPLPFPLGT